MTTENIALGSLQTTVQANAGFSTAGGLAVLAGNAAPAGSTNVDGVRGFGAGAFSGVAGFGGPNDGNGIFGLAGSSAGNGVLGFAPGATDARPNTAAGVKGVGGNEPGVRGHSTDGVGVFGRSVNFHGVYGEAVDSSNGSAGVFGEAFGNGPAVWGRSRSSASLVGVHGQCDGPAGSTGVFGTHAGPSAGIGVFGFGGLDSGTGVLGEAGQVGVFGRAGVGPGVEGDSRDNTGVIGRATAAGNPNPGVVGSATNGYGVFGFSQNSNGIAGQSGAAAAGCVGFAGAAGGYGIYGGIAAQGGYAGGFVGPVLVVGDFTVSGGAKNAAVPHPDGSHRLLYCQESPEPWFEDFGRASLVGGKAQVKLDPDFAAVVKADDYHVFPVPEGDSSGLYVSSRSPTGFEVREQKGGASSLTFSYRVVARRKDIPGPRLEKVKLPNPIKELVKPPDPPKPPDVEKLRELLKPPATRTEN